MKFNVIQKNYQNRNKMKLKNIFFGLIIILFSSTNLQAQTNNALKNALLIAEKNKKQLENVSQLLVVYNEKPESFTAVFMALEKKAINGL